MEVFSPENMPLPLFRVVSTTPPWVAGSYSCFRVENGKEREKSLIMKKENSFPL